MQPTPRYWFRAKSYGWGWGLPLTWEGWVALALFVALLPVGAVFLTPPTHSGLFLAYAGALSLALVGVCYLKGEPPKWRWGGD